MYKELYKGNNSSNRDHREVAGAPLGDGHSCFSCVVPVSFGLDSHFFSPVPLSGSCYKTRDLASTYFKPARGVLLATLLLATHIGSEATRNQLNLYRASWHPSVSRVLRTRNSYPHTHTLMTVAVLDLKGKVCISRSLLTMELIQFPSHDSP